MKNSRGQMVVEMILLMVVLLAILGAIRTTLKENETITSLVQGPWLALSGMIQAGAWLAPQEAMTYHPNRQRQHSTVIGKEAN